jgi:ribonuclease HI
MYWGSANMPKYERVPGPQTRSRAHLWAVIRALELHPDPTIDLHVYTSSEFIVDCASPYPLPLATHPPLMAGLQKLRRWERNGWRYSDGTRVNHIDLLHRLHALLQRIPSTVHVELISGENNRAKVRFCGGELTPGTCHEGHSAPCRRGCCR